MKTIYVLLPILCCLFWQWFVTIATLAVVAWPLTVVIFFMFSGVPNYPRLPRRK